MLGTTQQLTGVETRMDDVPDGSVNGFGFKTSGIEHSRSKRSGSPLGYGAIVAL